MSHSQVKISKGRIYWWTMTTQQWQQHHNHFPKHRKPPILSNIWSVGKMKWRLIHSWFLRWDEHVSRVIANQKHSVGCCTPVVKQWSRCVPKTILTKKKIRVDKHGKGDFYFFFWVFQLCLWGSPFWVRFLHMWPFFNKTIEVVTFCLHGWCMVAVFFLLVFTSLGRV